MRLILLPGLDGTGELSAPLAAFLRQHEVEVIQFAGDLFRYDDVVRWLEPRLGTADYAIIAESFSGPLAIRLAAARPPGLKALILVASFAQSPRRVPPFVAGLLHLLPIRSARMIRLNQWLLVGKWGKPDFPFVFASTLRKVPKQTLIRRLREVLRLGEQDGLPGLQLPRLYVRASGDWLVPASRTNAFRKTGWRIETVAGPHLLLLTRPEAVADVIERFLEVST